MGIRLIGFFIKVIFISSSGALSPGPLSVASINAGLKKGWKAGFIASIGHAIVEFPLIVLISLGIAYILANKIVTILIGVIGSLFLFYLGLDMVKISIRNDITGETTSIMYEKPLLLGTFLSAFNPYFLIWWIFIGGILIIDALKIFGFVGVFILFAMHIWLDLVWLSILGLFGQLGKNLINTKGYKVFLGAMGLLFILFGVNLITSLTMNIHIFPF